MGQAQMIAFTIKWIASRRRAWYENYFQKTICDDCLHRGDNGDDEIAARNSSAESGPHRDRTASRLRANLLGDLG
jgi:hypothetical protein